MLGIVHISYLRAMLVSTKRLAGVSDILPCEGLIPLCRLLHFWMGLFQPTACSEHMITGMSKHPITVSRGLFTKGSYPCQPQRIDRLIIFEQSKGTWRGFSRRNDDGWLVKNIQFAQGQ